MPDGVAQWTKRLTRNEYTRVQIMEAQMFCYHSCYSVNIENLESNIFQNNVTLVKHVAFVSLALCFEHSR